MKLFFVRHGNADWPDWTGSDDERPLTRKGRKQTGRVARLLGKLCVEPSLVLSSPLPRAFQTAEIIANRLAVDLKEEPTIGKGFDLPALRVLLTRREGQDLMVVGHEPDFSGVIRRLTGGSVKMAKAGVARVDLESPESDGTLVWLLPPQFANV